MNKKYYQVQYKYKSDTDWDDAYWLSDVNGKPHEYDTYGIAYWAIEEFIDRMKPTITRDFCYRMVYCETKIRYMDTHYAEVTEE